MAAKEGKNKSLKTLEAQEEGSGVANPNTNPNRHHIPSEIIYNIVSRLPFEDIIRWSSVSTYWYKTIKRLPSNNLHSSKSEVLDILLLTGCFGNAIGNDRRMHMISSNQRGIDGKSKHKEIVQIGVKGTVVGSCNGLLCIADSWGIPYAIYNPITKDTMILPELKRYIPCRNSYYVDSCGFGFDLKSKKYKVVVAYDTGKYSSTVTGDIITIGESSWRRLLFPEELRSPIHVSQTTPFFNGAFQMVFGRQLYDGFRSKGTYQLDGILTLDIDTEKFNITNFSTFMDLAGTSGLDLHIFNIGNSLALVYDEVNGEPLRPHIWKILGVNADGSCNYRHTSLSVKAECKRLFGNKSLGPITPLGALGNDNFLFRVRTSAPNFDATRFNLVLYDTKNDEGSLVEVPSEVTSFWDVIIFQPSLVSLAL